MAKLMNQYLGTPIFVQSTEVFVLWFVLYVSISYFGCANHIQSDVAKPQRIPIGRVPRAFAGLASIPQAQLGSCRPEHKLRKPPAGPYPDKRSLL